MRSVPGRALRKMESIGMDKSGQASITRDEQNKFAPSTKRRQTFGQRAAGGVVGLAKNDRGAA